MLEPCGKLLDDLLTHFLIVASALRVHVPLKLALASAADTARFVGGDGSVRFHSRILFMVRKLMLGLAFLRFFVPLRVLNAVMRSIQLQIGALCKPKFCRVRIS